MLASSDGHLSVTVKIDKNQAEQLMVVAERNSLSLSELIADMLKQFAKYM